MNLLEHEPRQVALRVKQRVTEKGPHRVYVRESGVITVLPVADPRCDLRPQGHLVGSYTCDASVIDLEADLCERLREIEP